MVTMVADPKSSWTKPVSQEPNEAPWLKQIAHIAAKKRPDIGDPETLPPHLNDEFR